WRFPNARKTGDDPEPGRDHTDPTGPCLPARGRGGVVVHRALLGAGPGFPRHGVWPLVNIDTFQLVTGPKTDLWLVRMVGVLVAAIGVILLLAAWRRQTAAEVAVLAVASAATLAAIDVIYVSGGPDCDVGGRPGTAGRTPGRPFALLLDRRIGQLAGPLQAGRHLGKNPEPHVDRSHHPAQGRELKGEHGRAGDADDAGHRHRHRRAGDVG